MLSEIKGEVGPGGPDTSPHCCLGLAFLLSALTPVCSCAMSPGEEFSARHSASHQRASRWSCGPGAHEWPRGPQARTPAVLLGKTARVSRHRSETAPRSRPAGRPLRSQAESLLGSHRTQGPRTPAGMRLGLEVWGGGRADWEANYFTVL